MADDPEVVMKQGKLTCKQLKQINYELRTELVEALAKIGNLKKQVAELEKKLNREKF